MNSSCPTRLLSDTPAEGDFLGGAHARLADAIAEVIETEPGGKAIGLEGAWGAGKSTVLRLVIRRLNDVEMSEPTLVTVFDAWAHQGDPLRRTFLENLIRDLGPKAANWLQYPEKWQQRREELAKRRREENQQVFPRLSGRGALFALALLMMPTGVALLSIDWVPRWFGAFLAIAPLLAAIAIGIHIATCLRGTGAARTWRERLQRIGGRAALSLRHPVQYALRGATRLLRDTAREFPSAMLTAQTIRETKSVTTETADPTSVEFAETFTELLDEALVDDHRLVLAIDNLDRVDPDDALAIWSTLQTFLQATDHQSPQWSGRLWILVPFARDGLDRLWSQSDRQPKTDVAHSFMDKTFQVRFRVPPPALSNWSSFLRTLLEEALPNHDEADRHGVYRAFALRSHRELAKPTPRELKLFVNEVGVLHRQWHDTFRLEDYAGFVLLQRSGIVETVLRATPDDLPDARFARDIMGENWRDVLAALHYNTTIEVAREIVLREPIESALTRGDADVLRELQQGHPQGFWAVFEDAVPGGSGTWQNVKPREIVVVARTLSESQILGGSEPPRREAVAFLRQLEAAAAGVDAWAPFDEEMAEGLITLVRHFGQAGSFVQDLSSAVTRAQIVNEEDGSSEGAVSPTTWLASSRSLVWGLTEAGLETVVQAGFDVPLSPEQWIEEAAGLQDPAGPLPSWLGYLELREPNEIDAYVTPKLAPDQIEESVVQLVEITLQTRSSAALHESVAAAVSHLKTATSLGGSHVILILRVVRAGRAAGLIDDVSYEQLATEGSLLHHLQQAVSEQNPEAAAGLAFAFLESVPDAAKPPQAVGNSDAGHQALMSLLADPDTLPGVEERFVALALAAGGTSAVVRMVGVEMQLIYRTLRRFLDDGGEPFTQARFVLQNWQLIWQTIAETQGEDAADIATDFEDLIRRVESLGELISMIVSDTFVPDDSSFYLSIFMVSEDDKFAEWASLGLRELEADRWDKALRTPDDDVVNLTLELTMRGLRIEFGTRLVDGLVRYARDATNRARPIGATQQLQELLNLLPPHHRSGLRIALYGILEESQGKAKAGFFALFGEQLADRELLLGQPRFIERVCEPALQEGNIAGLRWIEERLQRWPDLFDAHEDKEAAQRFRDRIATRQEVADESDLSVLVVRIAAVLGIEGALEPEQEGDPVEEMLEDRAD